MDRSYKRMKLRKSSAIFQILFDLKIFHIEINRNLAG